MAAARHQTSLRLLVDRTHGHHHVRIRPRRSGRELRGAAAHDRSFADQVVDLLHRGPRLANRRHAADGWHPRTARHQPHHWLGTTTGIARDPRRAADGLRRQRSTAAAALARAGPRLRSPRDGSRPRHLHAPRASHLVPRRRKAHRMRFLLTNRVPHVRRSPIAPTMGLPLLEPRTSNLGPRTFPMIFDSFEHPMTPLPSNIPCSHASLTAVEWQRAMDELKEIGATFLSLWGADDSNPDNCDHDRGFSIHAASLLPEGAVVLSHNIAYLTNPTYPP